LREAYPIAITRSSNMCVVYIPDLDCNTQGESIADAMYMARDAIELLFKVKTEAGLPFPKPSDITYNKVSDGEIVTLVDVMLE